MWDRILPLGNEKIKILVMTHPEENQGHVIGNETIR